MDITTEYDFIRIIRKRLKKKLVAILTGEFTPQVCKYGGVCCGNTG